MITISAMFLTLPSLTLSRSRGKGGEALRGEPRADAVHIFRICSVNILQDLFLFDCDTNKLTVSSVTWWNSSRLRRLHHDTSFGRVTSRIRINSVGYEPSSASMLRFSCLDR